MKPKRTWLRKFSDATRGVWLGMAGERSFLVHIPVALAVVALALLLRVERWEWCLLLGCIFAVLTVELFNSAVEAIARAVDSEHNPLLGRALDIASGAVLVASIGAAIIGVIVFLPRVLEWLGSFGL